MSKVEPPGSSPDATEAGSGQSPTAHAPEQTLAQRKSAKRDRVALACQRCKSRKQKCDGQRPACASCARLSLKCVYIVPLVPAAGEKKLYIKALEQRVAELEGYLASLGHVGIGTDHIQRLGQATASAAPGSQAAPSQHSQQTPPAAQATSDDEGNDLLSAVRDLSLSASGHYVGASSNISIGRVLSSVVQNQKGSGSGSHDDHAVEGEDDPAPKSVYSTQAGEMIGVPLLTDSVATRLMQGWFRHIATRYPVMHTARVMHLHNNRDHNMDECDRTVLHLVYAVSGRWLESSGEMGHFFSDQHFDVAFEDMDTMLDLRDSRTLEYLLLMALYCTRAPRDPGAWTYVGAAMRLCIELGLHRRPKRQSPSLEYEMNKRRFWTTYFLDRDISIAIGRPPSISDHDIDAELPLDIAEEETNEAVVQQAALRASDVPVYPKNSLTSFIHRLRLKQIESSIQHVIYRVDRSDTVSDATVQSFLDQLNRWNDTIPEESKTYVQKNDAAYEGSELFTIHYHRCVRFLLYPQLAETPVNLHYVKLCADSCAGIIVDYRRIHQKFPIGFSALSIQSMFLAGLTLIYCAWLAPPNYLSVDGPLTDCQILLYIVTERYPSARKYRDLFERIKSAMLTLIAQGKHEPRNPVNLGPNVQDGFTTLQSQWGGNGMGADFSFMINTMTGGDMMTSPLDLTLESPQAPPMFNAHQGQPTPEMTQYQVWPGMTPTMSHDMSGMSPMNSMPSNSMGGQGMGGQGMSGNAMGGNPMSGNPMGGNTMGGGGMGGNGMGGMYQ